MAKWADYLISHVKKDAQGEITHVLLHQDLGESVSGGLVKTQLEVINIIKAGSSVKTITWGYPRWNPGALVEVVRGINREHLRSHRDSTVRDNLDNMIPIYT